MIGINLEQFINTLTNGLNSFLIKNKFEFNEMQLNNLKSELNKELEKEFSKQNKTPTQIINSFLKQELNSSLILTPQDLGEDALNSILQWGIFKSKDFLNE